MSMTLQNKRLNQFLNEKEKCYNNFVEEEKKLNNKLRSKMELNNIIENICEIGENIKDEMKITLRGVSYESNSILRKKLLTVNNYSIRGLITIDEKELNEETYEKLQIEGFELFKRKNRDYGDAFANYGVIGVLVRIGDKIGRIQSITKNGRSFVNDESMRDTMIDLHNYSIMAMMLMTENINKISMIAEAGLGVMRVGDMY